MEVCKLGYNNSVKFSLKLQGNKARTTFQNPTFIYIILIILKRALPLINSSTISQLNLVNQKTHLLVPHYHTLRYFVKLFSNLKIYNISESN